MSEKTNILVVYAAMIPTARLVMDMMQGVVKITHGSLRGKISMSVARKDIAWADIILFVRGADPYMERIGEAAHKAGRFCMMYLDDDLLNVPSKGNWTYKNALKGCLYWCDLLWSSNPNVLKKYSRYMAKSRCVEEKVFEPIGELLPINEDTDFIKIVYAGSPSHAASLQRYIVPVLNDICNEYNNITVTFIGINENDLNKVKFKAEYISWFSNSGKYRKFLIENRYHIGLAVVPDTEFSRCKFYNKFLEYGKMGILGIYSDCEPYRFIVKDRENGILSKNFQRDWKQNLEEAIENHELRKNCVNNAQELIRKEFDIDKVLKQLIVKVPEVNGFKANRNCEIGYKVQKNWIVRLGILCWNHIVATKFGYWCVQRTVRIWHWIKC